MTSRAKAHAAHVEPILSARGIVNRFGQQVVHDRLGLDILPGEIIGIAGGSGSGKSVLLKTLIGLHRPDAGEVKSISVDAENPRLVLVEVKLRKDTPVKTDTRASLTLKGITGVVYIELNGGDPVAKTLLAVTPQGQLPEIPSENSGLKAMLDQLPKLVEKFSSIEDQVKKVVGSAGALTEKVKDNPSLLLRRPEPKH